MALERARNQSVLIFFLSKRQLKFNTCRFKWPCATYQRPNADALKGGIILKAITASFITRMWAVKVKEHLPFRARHLEKFVYNSNVNSVIIDGDLIWFLVRLAAN